MSVAEWGVGSGERGKGNGMSVPSCPARDRERCCGFSALAVRSGSVRMPEWGGVRVRPL